MTKTTEKESSGEFYTSVFLLVLGAIVTFLLSWYFGGFGYWNIPGMIILFAGAAVLIYGLSSPALKTPNPFYRGGLFVILIGLALLVSFLPHLLLGTYQIISLILTVIGIPITAYGLYKGVKA
jgi:hypothetical protein